jgi:hypothetical protein
MQIIAKTAAISLFLSFILHSSGQIVHEQSGFRWEWDPLKDQATLRKKDGNRLIWQGSLLPAFWIQLNNQPAYIKATADKVTDDGIITLQLGNLGTGRLRVRKNNDRIDLEELQINWNAQAPEIIEMFIGTRSTLTDSVNVPALWDRPFVPDWSAAAYCVPGAKEGPAQSYFRMWDFGQTTINLGNFGPSLSTPYGAAFPKPTLFAGMGSPDGWISFGAGEIPDAALNLKVLSTRGCFQYIYREDLWGANPHKTRTWKNLLRITFDTSAYRAFEKYYASFPNNLSKKLPVKSLFNTWGMWRRAIYPLQPITDFAAKIGSETLVMDDQWESEQGSGKIHTERFPHFKEDMQRARDKGITIGFWETLAWISDTVKWNLTSADLIVDKAGKPIRTNWSFDPGSTSFYCLDISSPKAKEFLQDRTRQQMQELDPVLLKLDFGYALPSPHQGVPRDPDFRGERYSYTLIKTIADAARSVNPQVIILNYGIGPLWWPVTDMVSLDDQGDLWYEGKQGHAEWSIWASLMSKAGVMVTGSSTYNWDDDKEVLLNTAIIGVPGASLPIENVSDLNANRRLALNKWFRRTVLWEPEWFNSETGNYDRPPALRCWGRKENGKITAIALRPEADEKFMAAAPRDIKFSGRWVLISQSEDDVYTTKSLAVVPFDKGTITMRSSKPKSINRYNTSGQQPFTAWKWSDGKLTIDISGKELEQIAGFLIQR